MQTPTEGNVFVFILCWSFHDGRRHFFIHWSVQLCDFYGHFWVFKSWRQLCKHLSQRQCDRCPWRLLSFRLWRWRKCSGCCKERTSLKAQATRWIFIVLCRLRRVFSEKHLAHLYGVAQSTVSRIFVPWINNMYLKFGQMCIWPSKEVVQATMLADFKEKFPTTRVIIDCTEVRCEMPSSLLLNSELFSSYKNRVTLKGLVGIALSGAITFISQLYTGSISDREIVMWSGFLSKKFENGDTVMADKGLQIADIVPLGVTLNIPPFLRRNTQISAEDVVQTQQIAGLRIHVETAINKIKNFIIWKGEIPLSLFSVVNQMWSVCAFLCNTRDPLISE